MSTSMSPGFTFVTNQVILARNAGALYNYGLGNATMSQFAASADLNASLNTVYQNSIGARPTAEVAKILVANLGITGSSATAAEAYVVGQLNPVAVNGRGKVINDILSAFSNLTGDPTFGSFATAFNKQVDAAVKYAAKVGNPDTNWATAIADSTFMLTASAAEVDEGGTAVFTLATKGVSPGTVFNYVLGGATGGDVVGGAVTGSATIDQDGKALIGFSFANDTLTEGDEKFTLSIAGKTAEVTVKDKSVSPPTPIVLTVSTDTATGTAANDTFTAPTVTGANTFTALDNLDGGAGVDTLSVAYTGAFVMPGGATVKNIEQVAISSNAGITLDTTSNFAGMTNLTATGSGAVTVKTGATVDSFVVNSAPAGQPTVVDGGKAVTVNVQGSLAAADTVTVGATAAAKGDVKVNLGSSVAGTAATAAITVKGGTSIVVDNTFANTTTAGNSTGGVITITGTADTTSVTVTQPNSAGSSAGAAVAAVAAVANVTDVVAAVGGVKASAVTITDVNGAAGTGSTIKSVTLKNYDNSTIVSGALETLTLSAGGKDNQNLDIASGTLTVTDNTPVPTVKTLALNLGGGRLGNITANSYETINASLTSNTRIGNLTDAALKTLNIDGAGQLRTGTIPATLTAINLKSDKAALRSDISSTAVLNFDASISTATNYVTLNAAVQSFTAGSGNDTASISVAPTKVLDGGAGTDTLIYGGSGAALTASIAPNVKNFEVFQAAAAGGVGTVDMANFTNSTFASVVSASNSGTTTLSNVKVGTPLTISTASLNANALTALTTTSGTHVYQTSDYNGAAGSVTVTLAGVAPAAANSGGTVGSTHAGLTLTDATTTVGIGTVNLVSNASVAGGQHVITTLTDPNMFSLNISGTGGVQITNHTNNGGSISIKDTHTGTGASGITTLTAANLASLAYDGTANYTIATIAGNAVPTLTISNTNLSPSTGLLTVGALTNATATAVFLNGAVALTGTFTSATKVVGGTNNANVTLTAAGGGAGTTITLGNGNNSITGGAGNDTITTGTGASTVTGAAGGDTITFGAGHTGVATVVYTATGETSSTAVSNGASIVSAAAGYDVITGLRGGDKVDLQGLTANAFTAAATALTTSLLTAGTNGDIAIVRGNWNSLTGYFTTSATGSDSLLQWDSNGTAAGGSVETIVLVGFANSATTSTNDGLITLG